MDLQFALKGAKIIEAIENYSIAEEESVFVQKADDDLHRRFYSDQDYWKMLTDETENFWHKKISLSRFVVSVWVARVPGLFWSKSAQSIREHTQSEIAFESKDYLELHPPGKSRKVIGGIGTLLLPPNEDGKVLMSVTSTCNASAGIPILVYPEVIDKLKPGLCIDVIDAKWQPMDVQWAKQFATTQDIPRGYLVIDTPDKVRVFDRDFYPVAYHPFSIMEYQDDDALLFDFVFVSADTKSQDIDRHIEEFFKDYRKKNGRNGEYLLNPNIVRPIFESRYTSPSELQLPSEKAKLKLLYQRIRDVHFKDVGLSVLIRNLPKFYQNSTSIKTLAQRIGLSPALLADDSASSMSAQLISLCIDREKVEELIDRLVYEYPEIFK